MNYKFFKVSPSVLDPIFGFAADSTWDTDQLLVNSYIGCYVARNLSRDGCIDDKVMRAIENKAQTQDELLNALKLT